MVANIRALLRDEREWVVAARVEVLDGQSLHYEVNAEGDVIVSCVTLLHGVPIWANLDTLAGGSDGSGVWFIPDPGTEVKIGFDHGDFEGEAYILMRTSAGKAPQGLASGNVFILGSGVEIRTPGGTVEKTIRAQTYRSHEDTLINAIQTAMTAINTYATAIQGIADPLGAATATLTAALTVTLTAAITAFQSAAATYLTTVVKVE